MNSCSITIGHYYYVINSDGNTGFTYRVIGCVHDNGEVLRLIRLGVSRVLLTLVGSGRLQPSLSNFYHHLGLIYHPLTESKRAEILCLMQVYNT